MRIVIRDADSTKEAPPSSPSSRSSASRSSLAQNIYESAPSRRLTPIALQTLIRNQHPNAAHAQPSAWQELRKERHTLQYGRLNWAQFIAAQVKTQGIDVALQKLTVLITQGDKRDAGWPEDSFACVRSAMLFCQAVAHPELPADERSKLLAQSQRSFDMSARYYKSTVKPALFALGFLRGAGQVDAHAKLFEHVLEGGHLGREELVVVAKCAFDDENLDLSRRAYEHAEKLYPGCLLDPEPLGVYIKSCIASAEYDAALPLLEAFALHHAGSDAVSALHCVCLFKTGSIAAARAHATRLLRHACSPTVLNGLGEAMECFDADLLQQLQAAAKTHASDQETLLRDIARQWLRLEQPSAAVRALKDVLDVKPADVATALELATLCESSGDLHGALVAMELAAKNSRDVDVLTRRMRLEEALGLSLTSLETLREIVKQDPRNGPLQRKLGEALLQSGDFAGAIQPLKVAIAHPATGSRDVATTAKLHRDLATARMRTRNNLKSAEESLLHALRLDEHDWQGALLLAQLRTMVKAPRREAIHAAYSLAIHRNPKCIEARLGLCGCLMEALDKHAVGKAVQAPDLQRQDALGSLLIACNTAFATDGALSPAYAAAAAAARRLFGEPPAAPNLLRDLRFVQHALQALGARYAILAPLPEPVQPLPETLTEQKPAALAGPSRSFAVPESVPVDPSSVILKDGRAAELLGVNRDGYPVVRVDDKDEWHPWTPAWRAQWATMQEDGPLAAIPEEQIHRNVPAALRAHFEAMLDTPVCTDSTASAADYANRACGLDTNDATVQRYEYFIHGGSVRDAVRAYYTNEAFAPPRDIDILTTAPPGEAMLRIWSLDRGRMGSHGSSGMSAPYQNYAWGTTTYGMLDMSSVAHKGTLEAPKFIRGAGVVPCVVFGNDLSKSGSSRDLTVNSLAYCPKRKCLIELVPHALQDAIHGSVRPASEAAARNTMLALRALKYLHKRPDAKIAAGCEEVFHANALTYWSQPRTLAAAMTRLLGSSLSETGDTAGLGDALKGYARTAHAHGLGAPWDTIIAPQLDGLTAEIATRLARRRG